MRTNEEFRYQVEKKHRLLFICASVLTIINSLLMTGISLVFMTLIDSINSNSVNELLKCIILSVVYMLVFCLINFGMYKLKNNYAGKCTYDFKNLLAMRLFEKDIPDFFKRQTGEYVSYLSSDIQLVRDDYFLGVFACIEQLIVVVASLAVVLYLNWVLAGCVIVAAIIPFAFTMLAGRSVEQAEIAVSESNSKYTSWVKDMLNGFRVIKSFSVEKQLLSLFDIENSSNEKHRVSLGDENGRIELISTIAGYIVLVVTFAAGAFLAFSGKLTVGSIVAFVQLANNIVYPAGNFAVVLNKRSAATSIINKLLSNTARESAKRINAEYIDDLSNGIEVKNVSFGYEQGINVLKDISHTFRKGKKYAIVGQSGSGKTTLVHLLMGYYTQYEGSICFDGIELKDIDDVSLYRMVSIIDQNVFLFDDVLKENILLYRKCSMESLECAINQAGLSALVKQKGLDYACGENGSKLSGGERQRISIARCLVQKNPIIICDEFTSSLDEETASEIEATLLAIPDTTSIVITHRLNEKILSSYDEIIVMENGRICEYGSFTELMQKEGFFYALYCINNRDYD